MTNQELKDLVAGLGFSQKKTEATLDRMAEARHERFNFLMPFLFLIVFFLPLSLHAEIKVWVNQNPVIAGDSFQLNVEADGSWGSDELDLSPLQDFRIVNQSMQSQTSIVNMQMSRKTQWTFALIARKSGQYRIPAFRLGNTQSQSLLLRVLRQGQNAQAQQGRRPDLYVEGTLDSKKVYIQQQILYTLKIFRSVSVRAESIGKFVVDNAVVEELAQSSGTERIQGKQYQITQIKFAIFPQKSGLLNIPAIQYQGEILASNRNRSRFGFGNFFNNRGQQVQRETKTYSVTVLPKPDFVKNWWLPAMGVQLMQSWQPDPPIFRVGEPVTRNFTLTAVGVSGSQLPELQMELPEGIKNYSDKPVIESSKSAQGIVGSRKEVHALIPSRPGTLVLPEVRLQWWHIPSGKMKEVVIPEQSIQVEPALMTEPPNSTGTPRFQLPESQKASSAPESTTRSAFKSSAENPLWQYSTFALGTLWLLTLAFWYRQFSQQKKDTASTEISASNVDSSPVTLKQALKQLRLACKQQDAAQAKLALIQWGNVTWSDAPPRNLEQLAQRLPELQEGLSDLNAALYQTSKQHWDSQKLLQTFDGLKLPSLSKQKESVALPPLWS